jgi:tetrahydromethanopterin S-methyltransferase subunit G
MVITEEARNHLYNTLREKFGPRDAATMMDLLPPVGWADVARQRDVDRLEATMERRFDEMDARLGSRFDDMERRVGARVDEMEARVGARVDEMEGRVGSRFDDMEARVGARFDDLGTRFASRDDLREQTNRFIGWMVASNATLVATVALLISLR